MGNDDSEAITAAHAFAHAEAIVKIAKEQSGVDLDFSPESLVAVDEIIEGFRREDLTVDEVLATLFSFGCYLGEILVRNHGGAWKKADDTPMKGKAGAPLVVELPHGHICNPLRKTYKRMQNGPVDSVQYFYQVVTRGLK